MTDNTTGQPAGGGVCACGHDRTHRLVESKARYGFWGWAALAMGATVTPRRIDRVCKRCGQTVESITDPAELQRHV